jgi:SAM-dependent methyltransferase
MNDQELIQWAARTFADAASAAAAGDESAFHQLLWKEAEPIREYLQSLFVDEAPPSLTEQYVNDAYRRFLHTLCLVPLPPPARILEIGSNPYFFHVLLHKLFPASEIEGANFFEHDIYSRHQGTIVQAIRSPRTGEVFEFSSRLFSLETMSRYPYPASSFDLIFFCETLEHLVLDPLPTPRKLKRILRPGGHLVISLPNAVRLTNFGLMLHGHNFFDVYSENGVHGRHNREFTLAELKHLIQKDGFMLRRAETHDRYDYEATPIEGVDYSGESPVVPERRGQLLEILKQSGGALEDRGDNLYVVAQKPLNADTRALREPPREALADGPLPVSKPQEWVRERLVFSVDRFADSPSSLTITGWAFRRDGDSPRQSAHLVLESAAVSYVFRAPAAFREDAADANGLSWDDPGFHLELDKSVLAPGSYQVGLLVCSEGKPPAFQPLALASAAGEH